MACLRPASSARNDQRTMINCVTYRTAKAVPTSPLIAVATTSLVTVQW